VPHLVIWANGNTNFLAGLRDLNYARVRATDQYMRTCHEIFAVARIDRATTDVGLRDIVNRCGGQRPLRIVCTRSEVFFI
jgi:hypothetical protein